jgi:hypothetical protein
MTRRLLRGVALVMALTSGALLPSRPAGAQSPRAAFALPSTPSGAAQIAQGLDVVLCPEGVVGRVIIVDAGEDFAGALVIFTALGTPSGVIEFSFSSEGPFTDTLEVPVQLDGTGSGTSSPVFLKGIGPGVAVAQACSAEVGCLANPFTVTVVGIAAVDFDALDSPLDDNPNTGEGLRIYPDRDSPEDAVNRRTVRVQAFSVPPEPGLSISFRSFDVDDPSSDSRPVDSNGAAADDNIEPGPGILTALVAETDASGIAETVLTVSMQPGDNFKVAAACSQDYLLGLVVEGVDLKDADGNFLPTNQGSSTDMLTVWRRLHIEVDSMGNVFGNQVTGFLTGVIPNPKSFTTKVEVSGRLEEGRFQGGLIKIAHVGSFPVTDNSDKFVTLPGTLTEGDGRSFTLWDDDDFNGDDSGPLQLNGDDGENVTAPSVSQLDDSLDDGVCNNSSANLFGVAYVCPVFDLVGAQDDAPFVLNVADKSTSALEALYSNFDDRTTEDDPTFWTVYLLGAYQYITKLDFDPNDLSKKSPIDEKEVLGATDEFGGWGAAIFKETLADKNRSLKPGDIRCDEALIVAHEIGHLFGSDHKDGGIMFNFCDTIVPVLTAETIAKVRTASNP